MDWILPVQAIKCRPNRYPAVRYIVLFLLAVNIVYFIWALTHSEEEATVSSKSRELLNTGLMLVSEFEAQTAALALENPEDLTLCSSVSGFSTVDDANNFILDAKQANLDAILNLTGSLLASQFRVYLPPEANRIAASRSLDRVEAALTDAQMEVETYLITRGAVVNGIGLGIYGLEEEANLVQDQVSELGFEAQIEEIPRSDGEIQVVLRPSNSDKVQTSEWLELSSGRPYLIRSENLCETIAQASQFP